MFLNYETYMNWIITFCVSYSYTLDKIEERENYETSYTDCDVLETHEKTPTSF